MWINISRASTCGKEKTRPRLLIGPQGNSSLIRDSHSFTVFVMKTGLRMTTNASLFCTRAEFIAKRSSFTNYLAHLRKLTVIADRNHEPSIAGLEALIWDNIRMCVAVSFG